MRNPFIFLHLHNNLINNDLYDNCIEESVPVKESLSTTKTHYLAHSVPSSHTDALGNASFYEYDYYHQNAHGQRVCKKIAIDHRGAKEEIFDTHGNLSYVLCLDPMGALISKKELFYDGAGNCTSTLEYALATDKIIKTLFFYGPNNRLEKIVEAADTPEAKTTTYTYNSYGQKECVIHSDGTTVTTLYDKKGRVEYFYAGDNSLNYSYAYDESDKILSVTNNRTNQKTHRSYNEHGDLISETLESGLSLQYGYDNAGRLTTLTLPDSSTVGYDYSPVHLASISRNGWKHEITERDLSGKALSQKLPHNAGSVQSDHDLLLRTTTLRHTHFIQENVKYDPVGNLLQQNTTDAIGAVESSYSYDFLSQLTSESGNANHSYAYNALYDRLKLDDKEYVVNSLHSVRSDGTKEYAYDARGKRTTAICLDVRASLEDFFHSR
jgi:YD repeat-containing protein